jgi:polysaccharide pyruvyl transferase WcaK-like protein
MHWAIQGYYGVGNLGDDLMLYLLQEQIMALDERASFTVIHSFRGQPDRIVSPPGANTTAVANSAARRVWHELKRSDVVLFGGGTCFHDHGTCGVRVNVIARALGKPVYWVGIGADRINDRRARLIARVSLRACTAVTVRDRESAAALGDLAGSQPRVTVTDDLVFLLPQSPTLGSAATRSNSARTLLIGWRDYREGPGVSNAELASNVAAAAVAAARDLDLQSIHVLPIADVIDEAACARVTRNIEDIATRDGSPLRVCLLNQLDLPGKLTAISEATLFLSGRLHGGLVGKLFGVPTLVVRYAEKVDRFLSVLDRDSGLSFDALGDVDTIHVRLKQELAVPSTFREDPSAHATRAHANIQMLIPA